ncbi:hypothetical protein ACOSP7_020595 [Xanthoceras sorbifolium]
MEGVPGLYSSERHGRHLRTPVASYCYGTSPKKINLISCEPIILHLILAKRPRKVCFDLVISAITNKQNCCIVFMLQHEKP